MLQQTRLLHVDDSSITWLAKSLGLIDEASSGTDVSIKSPIGGLTRKALGRKVFDQANPRDLERLVVELRDRNQLSGMRPDSRRDRSTIWEEVEATPAVFKFEGDREIKTWLLGKCEYQGADDQPVMLLEGRFGYSASGASHMLRTFSERRDAEPSTAGAFRSDKFSTTADIIAWARDSGAILGRPRRVGALYQVVRDDFFFWQRENKRIRVLLSYVVFIVEVLGNVDSSPGSAIEAPRH